jgi:NADH dehydrogenase
VELSVSVPHIVITGGGFGGLAAARALADAPVRITLVDRRNHHLSSPCSTRLRPLHSVRVISRGRFGESCGAKRTAKSFSAPESIHRFARKVILGDDEIGYDYLVIASGATHSYFGHDAWERDAPGLKTLEDALEIRRRVLVAYEAAEREPDPEIAHETQQSPC